MLLREGSTCWKRSLAERVAVVIDPADYFDHLATALEKAHRSILVAGWDIHSRLELRRGEGIDPHRYRLAPFLDRLVSEQSKLEVHLLLWDFPMLYAAEREILQGYRLGWKSHRRIHFELDSNHPIGASHHQKLIVIDDAIGFVGGIDLTQRRWDTPDHSPADPLRRTPEGNSYIPYHDIEMAVSGPAARTLGDLFRQRWHRATGRRIPAVETPGEAWPDTLESDLGRVEVGISRTDPEHDGRAEVREIEHLYTQAIAMAEHSVILENQYATSAAVLEALAESLGRDRGPEILLILPRETSGWLEIAAVGRLRRRFLERLHNADRHHRFLPCFPHRSGLGDDWIKVHSKVCFVDDWFLTVGSANLSNRSMGLDTECNLALEVDEPRHRQALRQIRHRLLGEHLDSSPEEVGELLDQTGSLAEALHRLGSEERDLRPLAPTENEDQWVDGLIPDRTLLDPERPLEVTELLEEMGGDATTDEAPSKGGWWKLTVVVLLATFLALAWRFGPLSDWLTGEQVEAWIQAYRASPAALPLTIGLFVVGGVIFFPVTLLILQTTAVLGPAEGALYSLAGSLASAVCLFALGRAIGASTIRRWAGGSLRRVTRFLARRGTLSVAAIRLTPIAPFSLVNLGAGAVGVRWVPFVLGTLVGMMPGIVALTWIGDRAAAAIRSPSWHSLVLLAIAALVVLGLARLAARWTTRFAAAGQDQ